MLFNYSQKFLRNLAVIAHVDHGKTTLVDSILKQMGTKITSMDTLALEKERGITILSKVTGIPYKDYFINFVDTPGHADFGGQVERVMSIVDGVLLVVCATEGPMPQTRYVLQKAISAGLRPIVVMNKLDRPTSQPGEVEGRIFDLFCSLDVKEEQLEYPILYASGRAGWVDNVLKGPRNSCSPLLEKIVSYIPPPKEKEEGPFQMMVSMTENSSYHGKMLIGKVRQGEVKVGDSVHVPGKDGAKETGRIQKIFKTIGQEKFEIAKGIAGDIITLTGISAQVNDTISHPASSQILAALPIDMPTLTLKVRINDSPLNGLEGKKTSFMTIKDRLLQEAENDLALKVKEGFGCMEVSGRGELHLGILIEQLRREDFELALEAPMIVTKEDDDGNVLEPIEEVVVEVPSEYQTAVTELFLTRLAHFEDMKELSATHTRLIFHTPTRTMMGFKAVLLGVTKGNLTIESHIFDYQPYKGPLTRRQSKVVISTSKGTCTEYGVSHLEEKGVAFVEPGIHVYEGMLIGETQVDNEILLNPSKEKRLTNVRSVQKEEFSKLSPKKNFTVEEAVAYINEDELVEVTPRSIRMRKKILSFEVRKKSSHKALDA
jgi:GTP-binding protein